eukprot:5646225-Pyramimonas_sp.AAC.1
MCALAPAGDARTRSPAHCAASERNRRICGSNPPPTVGAGAPAMGARWRPVGGGRGACALLR